jgi:glycosyltransferase involved in cell wall biosynthesis
MLIIVFSKPYWPSIGGVESSSRILARVLTQAGCRVIVITATQLGGLAERDDGFAVCRDTSFRALLRHTESANAVIINGGLSVPAAFATWLRGKPFAVWHQMAGGTGLMAETLSQRIRLRMEAMLTKRASLHVGASEACLESKDVPAHVPRTVIFNPVAPELEAHARQRSQTQRNIDVLFVGRLFKGKGIFILADALAQIGGGGKTLRACFVGVGPDEGMLRDALAKTPNVQAEFMGGLAVERLSEVYPRARCLAVPSTTHPEGMPLVIGEALTFGVPVVGSDQPAIVEAIGDCGRICPQGNSAALAHALESLLADEAARTQLSQRALLRSERFSSSRFAAAAQRLVAEMVSNRQ